MGYAFIVEFNLGAVWLGWPPSELLTSWWTEDWPTSLLSCVRRWLTWLEQAEWLPSRLEFENAAELLCCKNEEFVLCSIELIGWVR